MTVGEAGDLAAVAQCFYSSFLGGGYWLSLGLGRKAVIGSVLWAGDE